MGISLNERKLDILCRFRHCPLMRGHRWLRRGFGDPWRLHLASALALMSLVSCGGEPMGGGPGTGGDDAADGSGGEPGASGGHPGTGGGEASGGQPGSGGSPGGEPGCVDDALAGACLLPIACTVGQSPFGGGDGTEQAPFAICSTAHLLAVDDEDTAGRFFVLAASLDLSAVTDFVPLGTRDAAAEEGVAGVFEGTFDGAGRALRGLTIDRPDEDNIGLFSWTVKGSLIHDLQLIDFTARGASAVGLLAGRTAGNVVSVHTSGVVDGRDTWAGGVVGYSWGSMSHSSSTATVTGTDVAGGLVGVVAEDGEVTECESSGSVFGDFAIGGLLGGNAGSATDCRSSADVRGSNEVGGLVGQLSGGTVLRGEASGTVSGTEELVDSGRNLGGLIGTAQVMVLLDASVLSSRATGAVRGSEQVGGLIGGAGNTTVDDCEASGTVHGTTEVGGLIGYAHDATITTSRASGAVSAGSTVGGLVGALDGNSYLATSAATGDVTGTENLVGGLIGQLAGGASIGGVYSVGQVTGNGDVGGLVGGGTNGEINQGYAFGIATGTPPTGGLVGTADLDADASIGSVTSTACYYREESPASQGTPLSLAAFADVASFEGWDFATTWVMSAELGRPVLSWE